MSNTSNLFSVGQGHNDTITLTEPYDKSSFFCVWVGHIICSFLITKQLSGVLWSKHNKANMYLPGNLQTETCSINKPTITQFHTSDEVAALLTHTELAHAVHQKS